MTFLRDTHFTVKWKILIIIHKLYGLVLPGFGLVGHFLWGSRIGIRLIYKKSFKHSFDTHNSHLSFIGVCVQPFYYVKTWKHSDLHMELKCGSLGIFSFLFNLVSLSHSWSDQYYIWHFYFFTESSFMSWCSSW